MKTDDLVALLATGVAPVPPHAARRRIGQALFIGLPVSMAILFIGFGVRDDIASAMLQPMFWVKLLFPLCIAAAALVALHRLGRPGIRTGWTWAGLLLPILAVWALALGHKLTGFLVDQIPAVQGGSWLACVMSIALISLPVLVATLLALRELAPTRPALAGAAAGALAGGVAAAVFALHCKELAPASLAIWHLLGMVIPTLAGALLGRRLLRW
ncbi:NrsF family protein [Acidovorax cavernicola]|uniref:DUF1109 domain-containing protein n=1 Tax=Acidovorax cavernicola TaxID=1675792 RepID=A0A9X8GUP8_9BURK|nr:DUF1109 domain-containing protein [Acidovorax cavernicola]RIX77719.1 DUF1109 domain-containing protein [Acidovorax cavernicola]